MIDPQAQGVSVAGMRPGMSSTLRSSAGALLERLSPRQRQYLLLLAILVGGVGLLWAAFALSDSASRDAASRPRPGATPAATVTNLGVMPAGQQVNPVDQWVGTAGSKLAQYEREREEQDRLNKDRQAFEAKTLQRFADLEQRLTSAAQGGGAAGTAAAPPPAPSFAAPPAPLPAALPARVPPMPPGQPPMPSMAGMSPALSSPAMPIGQFAAGNAPLPEPPPVIPPLVRVSLVDRSEASTATAGRPHATQARTVASYLPVSFTRGVLLGGLDAPSGGQAQSNPHPVLIRLSDNSVLPNRFRGEYRDCFVIAAGYGDISAERAYLRTESLSCVRSDGATLEVRIQGSVFGEDGKVGMRGRLVTKQGQMLANALLAGVASGIGQGIATASTQVSSSALGSITTASGADAYRAGLGAGVGRALDRLAQYYIKLAENTFPVIEIDAGREVDVVITKGVRIDMPAGATPVSFDPYPDSDEASDASDDADAENVSGLDEEAEPDPDGDSVAETSADDEPVRLAAAEDIDDDLY